MTVSGNWMHPRSSGVSAGLFTLATVGGCGVGAGGELDGLVVRDSAGVEIVEHSAAYIAALPVWGVDGEPILDLGGGDHPAEEFTSIRGAIRFSDGRVLLAEGGSNELRLFGPDGAYLATWARRGQGPGEFSSISSPVLGDGDTVMVTDLTARRTSRFDPDGRFLDQFLHPRSPDQGSHVNLVRTWADGRLLMESWRMASVPGSPTGPEFRDTLTLGWMTEGATRFDTLAMLPGDEMFPTQVSEGGQFFATNAGLIFGRSTRLGHDGLRLFVGTNEANEIHLFVDGAMRRLIRNGTRSELVMESHRAEVWRRSEVGLARSNLPEASKTEWRANFERTTRFADTFPYHDRLMIATDGALWVEKWRQFEDQGRRFVIYDTAGRAIARAEFPERVRPLQVGPDYLVGMWRDPDDVPFVRVWRVRGQR